MKHKGNLNLLIQTIDQVSFDLATQETKIFKQLLVYILRANPNKKEAAGRLVQKLIEPLKEYSMTLYDQFVEEVSQKYLQEKQQLELTVQELLAQIERSEKTVRIAIEAERQEALKAIRAKEVEAKRALEARELEIKLEAQRALEAKEVEVKRALEAKEFEAQQALEAKELEAKRVEAQQMKTLAEQEHNKLLDMVKKLLLLGMDVVQIADITGIEIEEIKTLQKSLIEG
jgi:primosomal protein N'